MKGLKALERLGCVASAYCGEIATDVKDLERGIFVQDQEAINVIEKELKALEIIKDICNLKVYKNKLGQCFLEGTNILFPISQTQYDLLKEVLL